MRVYGDDWPVLLRVHIPSRRAAAGAVRTSTAAAAAAGSESAAVVDAADVAQWIASDQARHASDAKCSPSADAEAASEAHCRQHLHRSIGPADATDGEA